MSNLFGLMAIAGNAAYESQIARRKDQVEQEQEAAARSTRDEQKKAVANKNSVQAAITQALAKMDEQNQAAAPAPESQPQQASPAASGFAGVAPLVAAAGSVPAAPAAPSAASAGIQQTATTAPMVTNKATTADQSRARERLAVAAQAAADQHLANGDIAASEEATNSAIKMRDAVRKEKFNQADALYAQTLDATVYAKLVYPYFNDGYDLVSANQSAGPDGKPVISLVRRNQQTKEQETKTVPVDQFLNSMKELRQPGALAQLEEKIAIERRARAKEEYKQDRLDARSQSNISLKALLDANKDKGDKVGALDKTVADSVKHVEDYIKAGPIGEQIKMLEKSIQTKEQSASQMGTVPETQAERAQLQTLQQKAEEVKKVAGDITNFSLRQQDNKDLLSKGAAWRADAAAQLIAARKGEKNNVGLAYDKSSGGFVELLVDGNERFPLTTPRPIDPNNPFQRNAILKMENKAPDGKPLVSEAAFEAIKAGKPVEAAAVPRETAPKPATQGIAKPSAKAASTAPVATAGVVLPSADKVAARNAEIERMNQLSGTNTKRREQAIAERAADAEKNFADKLTQIKPGIDRKTAMGLVTWLDDHMDNLTNAQKKQLREARRAAGI